jgi:hypothetical protein
MSSLYAQQTNLKSVFVSANIGVYDVANDQFGKVYNSNLVFMPGITLGIPISTRIYFYNKLSYFSKDGVPVNNIYALQNGNWVLTSESKGGTAKFKEWLINSGLLYNLFLTDEYTFGINGGITFVSINEEKEGPSGSYSSTGKGGGLLGIFGGILLERNFDNSPFSIVGEVQYNFSRRDILSFVGNYGGFNINLGCRFYFSDRRKQ